MSPKKASLQSVLSNQDEVKVPLKSTAKNDKEVKQVKVIYKIPSTAKNQFDRLALDLEKTKQATFREALNDFFRKHGKPEIA